jgi:hypothetical protein
MSFTHQLHRTQGRQALNIPALPGVEIVPFRLRPGDDASCLQFRYIPCANAQ